MVVSEMPNSEGWTGAVVQSLLAFFMGVGALVWKLTYGRMDRQISDLYKKAGAFEKSCNECRQDNDGKFAIDKKVQSDLAIVRQTHTEMLQHIDRRFDNLTAIIVGRLPK